MKKKSSKNEYAEMLSFVDSLISSTESEVDCLLNSCSELYHEVKARELLMEEKQKIASSHAFLFSPNDPGEFANFDNDWLAQLDELKKLYDEKSELLKASQKRLSDANNLRKFISKNEQQPEDNTLSTDELMVTKDSGMRFLEIQELERNRIANELHDSAVQNLTGLIHKGELCMRLFDIDPVRARMEMSTIIDVARETIDDIRSSIFELRPASIDDFGLSAAIEDYCNKLNPDHRMAFMIYKEGNEFSLPNNTLVNLYRIAQEACVNIMKHSKATKAAILLKYTDEDVTLTITDNGVGISQETLDKAYHSKTNFGLKILHERADLINGDFSISNKPEGGLQIKIVVPNE